MVRLRWFGLVPFFSPCSVVTFELYLYWFALDFIFYLETPPKPTYTKLYFLLNGLSFLANDKYINIKQALLSPQDIYTPRKDYYAGIIWFPSITDLGMIMFHSSYLAIILILGDICWVVYMFKCVTKENESSPHS